MATRDQLGRAEGLYEAPGPGDAFELRLEDGKGYVFPATAAADGTRLFNARVTNVTPHLDELRAAGVSGVLRRAARPRRGRAPGVRRRRPAGACPLRLARALDHGAPLPRRRLRPPGSRPPLGASSRRSGSRPPRRFPGTCAAPTCAGSRAWYHPGGPGPASPVARAAGRPLPGGSIRARPPPHRRPACRRRRHPPGRRPRGEARARRAREPAAAREARRGPDGS